MEYIGQEDRNNVVYVDESGIDEYLCHACGYAKRGVRVYGEVSGMRFARESFIAAKCGSSILAPACFQGTCDTAVFNCWIENFLVSVLKPGQVVVMDNASFHKSEKTKQLIENAGCELLFLPPYSPDLNPIETFWAHLKAKIRSSVTEPSLAQAIDQAFSACNIQTN